MKKVFVAGHRGMVGSAICRQLQKQADVGIITRTRNELDLCDQSAVQQFIKLEKPDEVILAAAKVGGIYANNTYPAEFIYQNLQIQNNVIHAAHINEVQKLLFLGSSCIYPRAVEQPMREDALLTGILEPTNEPYAIAKIAGIKMCESYNRQYGRDYRSVMPTNLYGPGDNYDKHNSHVLPALIRRFHEAMQSGAVSVTCWGTGSPLREFLHVNDLANAVVFCLEKWDPFSEEAPKNSFGEPLNHLNIGTGQDISISKLAEKISRLSGFQGEIIWDPTKPDGTPKKQLDIGKISTLGWKPQIQLDDGIRETIEKYKISNFH